MQDSLAQLKCLKEACKRLGFSFFEIDENGNLIEVHTSKGKLFFANFATPFNSGAAEHICSDKEFTFTLLHKVMKMPGTVGYFDPSFREGYDRFKKFDDVEEIITDIEQRFSYPLVVKKNSGMRGINVFLCKNREEAKKALEEIYREDSPDYDYVALAQEYVKPIAHIRAVFFQGKIVLSYKTEALWGIATRAGDIKDAPDSEIEKFIEPIQRIFPLQFAGADILKDGEGKLWLLELNSRPGFTQFIREHGQDSVIAMYEKILKLSA
ncbi:MAG TPA: hypothetical protein VJH94_05195 [Candidatus Paceibacterota bacterium]